MPRNPVQFAYAKSPIDVPLSRHVYSFEAPVNNSLNNAFYDLSYLFYLL